MEALMERVDLIETILAQKKRYQFLSHELR